MTREVSSQWSAVPTWPCTRAFAARANRTPVRQHQPWRAAVRYRLSLGLCAHSLTPQLLGDSSIFCGFRPQAPRIWKAANISAICLDMPLECAGPSTMGQTDTVRALSVGFFRLPLVDLPAPLSISTRTVYIWGKFDGSGLGSQPFVDVFRGIGDQHKIGGQFVV